jgi:outer membrane receptor protein involved in Fe transport
MEGDAIPLVPKWAATAYAGYSAEMAGGWDFHLRGEYQYQGKALYDFNDSIAVTYPGAVPGPAIPNPGQFQESFDVVNLSAGIGKGGTKLRIYANNLFDVRPLLDVDYATGSDRARTIRPRTIGVELRQSF